MKCKLYWINLQRCNDRAMRMVERFALHKNRLEGAEIVRIDATDANGAPKLIDTVTAPSHWTIAHLKRPEVACTLSHLRAIEKAYKDGCDWAIVLEDDVTFDFCENWPESISFNDIVANGAAQGANLLLLSWCLDSERNREAVIRESENGHLWMKVPRYSVYGSFAYAISRLTMERVLKSRFNGETETWNLCNGRRPLPITADAFLLQESSVMMSSVPLVAYECLDSTVHPNHLALHRKNLDFLKTRALQCSDLLGNVRLAENDNSELKSFTS